MYKNKTYIYKNKTKHIYSSSLYIVFLFVSVREMPFLQPGNSGNVKWSLNMNLHWTKITQTPEWGLFLLISEDHRTSLRENKHNFFTRGQNCVMEPHALAHVPIKDELPTRLELS